MVVSKAQRMWTSLCLGIGEEEKMDKTLFLMKRAIELETDKKGYGGWSPCEGWRTGRDCMVSSS